jgi:ribosomal protein S18 acetylase RimI-like enzyme
MIHIRPAQAAEWPIYRHLRLRALLDSPQAFGSTHASEASRSDEEWARRVATAQPSGQDLLLLAFHGQLPCGLLWCRLAADPPGMADLYQMWVAPGSRGLGTGRALLQSALDWARRNGARQARLGVTVADSPALHLYRSLGFQPVGAAQPLREGGGQQSDQDSSLMVQAMERRLEPA